MPIDRSNLFHIITGTGIVLPNIDIFAGNISVIFTFSALKGPLFW